MDGHASPRGKLSPRLSADGSRWELSPRIVASDASPSYGRNTWGSEARFHAEKLQLEKSRFVPGPSAYEVSSALQATRFPKTRVSSFGVPPPIDRELAAHQCIKIAAEDRDKPIALALKNTLTRNAGRVIDLFRDWDTDGNGMLDRGEFRDALKRMELNVDDWTEADAVFDSWNPDANGELSLPQLQSILKRSAGTVPSVNKSQQQIEAQRKAEAERKAKKLEAKMKHAAALKMKKPTPAQEGLLQDMASRLDNHPGLLEDWKEANSDKDGAMSRASFRRWVSSVAVGFEKEDISAFFDMLDPGGSGSIEVSRLEATLRWVHKSRRTTLVRGKEMVFRSERQFHDRIAEAFRANAPRIMDLFKECDVNNDGVLQRSEFAQALPVLGLVLEQAEADKLFDWFDDDGSGEISFEEFHAIIKNNAAKKRSGPVVVHEELVVHIDQVRSEVEKDYGMLKVLTPQERARAAEKKAQGLSDGR